MISILIGLVLLMLLAYLGWSIIWIAPLVSGIVAILSGMDILPAYTDTYMQGFVDFAKDYFPIFLFGAIFGKLMEDTGAAQSVAHKISSMIGKKRAILGMLLSAAILTYGGVSLFVVVFAVYPLAVAMFRAANVSRKLIPSTFVLGAFTFTMTALPGTPQIQNIIPINTFETDTMAAPILGIVAGLIMAVGGYFYLKFREKQLNNKDEKFTEPSGDNEVKSVDEEELPNWILSTIPLVAVVVTLNIFDISILAALLIGILLIMTFNWKDYKNFIKAINGGASGSVMATINTSAAVGFGTVVTASPGFDSVKDLIFSIPLSPFFSEAFAVSLLAMITGSASGGMGIALEALGQEYYNIAVNQGLSLEAFHRITSVASGASILPHNGALLTLFTVTGLTHKDSYKDVFVVGLLIPMVATIAIIFLAMMGIN
ncbi:H+/gluconate symporter [Halobacillus karajensis]|uniref:Fructuronate transporter n=1 Tax=Halobacillus karajensis TaxID=195088 RepID=A0A024P555_9BACI|nr:GntP family permease [Halobacillus karajensis]CDQ20521.1 fructuronate transporter [Halobacillus karajensis]CDQ24010.1 fructuronate transporter [Halobacillus karajensis]CDQ27488.1 fructuronate transporter [Halobacillus karajensis]SEH90465.1 H+/gluconate symporter [Halobacillus karajensis]